MKNTQKTHNEYTSEYSRVKNKSSYCAATCTIISQISLKDNHETVPKIVLDVNQI